MSDTTFKDQSEEPARTTRVVSVVSADERVAAARVHDYAILDTPREASFDRIVFTASQMFRVPIAVVALRDGGRLWFKAQVGLGLTEIPRAISFCNHLVNEDVMAVEDASIDQRFADNPLVTAPPKIRFYAGAPLLTPDGIRIGSLCVADRVPKMLLARQAWQLGQLAQGVVTMLELRRQTG